MRTITVALLLAVLSLISAQNTLMCSFSMRAGYLKNGGVITGKVTYDWANGAGGNIRWDYDAPVGGQSYYEIHQYNSDMNGYDVQSSIRYKDQWDYQVGAGCGCETGSLDNSMPIMAPRSGSVEAGYLSSGFTQGSQTINGIQCTTYTLPAANDDTYGGVTVYVDFYAFGPDGTLVQMGYSDGRTFTFSGCTVGGAVDQSIFNTPPDCKCGRPIDIVIVLDRSGSIDALEWRDQRAFVINFTASFDYGPLGANLAITNFNHDFWTTLTLAEGSTQQNVQTVVNAMACSGHPTCNEAANDWQTNPTMSCCCCGTSISGGMHNGALLLQQTTRGGIAQPILLTVTDGYHNTQLNGDSCGAFVPGGCSGDLSTTVNFCQDTIPGIIMYAVGVGDDRMFSTAELLICAQNVTARLLTVTSFTELAASTLELVARTCNENAQPCGAGCCGLCVCAGCQPVNQCDQPADKCITAAVPAGQTCCATNTVQCSPNNPCTTYHCDSNLGTCYGNATALPPSTQCTSYTCDPVQGIQSVSLNCTTKTDDCTTATDSRCNDNNACTVDTCDLLADPKKCEYTIRNCSNEAQWAPDMCSTVDCDTVNGCYRTEYPANYCDDGSNCTIDYCDPKVGCVNQLVDCADNDSCTVDTCNKVFGCLHTPVVCNASISQLPPEDANLSPNCILGFCVQQNDSNAQPLCATRSLDCPAAIATTTIVGAALGTAAIIGLVIAAVVVALAVAGGGAYAYSQNAGGGGLAVVGNNPIYSGNQNAGMNPLYNTGH